MNKIFGTIGTLRLFDFRKISTRITADGKVVPKRKNFENRITLIGTDNNVSITDLKNAESLSQKRELKLVKIQDVDSKTRRPIYKLMTNIEYHEGELEKRKAKQEAHQKNSIKGQKLLSISSKIGEHDLMTNVKKMIKLLEKQYEVKLIISGDGQDSEKQCERIFSVIEHNTKSSGSVVQKRIKGSNLKFQLLPLRNNSSSSKSDGDADSDHSANDKGPL